MTQWSVMTGAIFELSQCRIFRVPLLQDPPWRTIYVKALQQRGERLGLVAGPEQVEDARGPRDFDTDFSQ
jgi:hypothetical protein